MSDLKNCVSKLKNPEADQYDIILQNIHPGQILLLNKKADTSKGATLLREYEEDNIADFTHSVLVTENENHELMIIHSTEHKESEK